MRQGTIIVTPPDGHPVSIAAAKLQLQIEDEYTDLDAHIGSLCAAAHRKLESELGYPILRQTRQTQLHRFCGADPVWLGMGHDLQVDAVSYVNTAGVTQPLASTAYLIDAVSQPRALWPAYQTNWPDVRPGPGAVKINWTAGWAKASDVPEDLIHAMKLLIGHWDQNREAVINGSISTAVQLTWDDLLFPWRSCPLG